MKMSVLLELLKHYNHQAIKPIALCSSCFLDLDNKVDQGDYDEDEVVYTIEMIDGVDLIVEANMTETIIYFLDEARSCN